MRVDLAAQQLEPSATIVRPFSLRVAANLSPAEGELKGQADLGELSVLLTYSVRPLFSPQCLVH